MATPGVACFSKGCNLSRQQALVGRRDGDRKMMRLDAVPGGGLVAIGREPTRNTRRRSTVIHRLVVSTFRLIAGLGAAIRLRRVALVAAVALQTI